jgi:hypothetical protein
MNAIPEPTAERQRIDPHLFKPAVQKVRFIHRPKFYLARLQMMGVMYPIKTGKQYKTHHEALEYARKVHARWVRLYQSTPKPEKAVQP